MLTIAENKVTEHFTGVGLGLNLQKGRIGFLAVEHRSCLKYSSEE